MNKYLWLNNSKTRTAMNTKISILLFVLKRSYICHYVICITVPLSALSIIEKLLSFNKRRTLFKTFVEFQFQYCPILWIFHSRRTNNKINRLHERALSTFDQLIAMDKSFCIHHQNIQRLLMQIYKALHDISGNSLKELFIRRGSTVNLGSKPELVIPP